MLEACNRRVSSPCGVQETEEHRVLAWVFRFPLFWLHLGSHAMLLFTFRVDFPIPSQSPLEIGVQTHPEVWLSNPFWRLFNQVDSPDPWLCVRELVLPTPGGLGKVRGYTVHWHTWQTAQTKQPPLWVRTLYHSSRQETASNGFCVGIFTHMHLMHLLRHPFLSLNSIHFWSVIDSACQKQHKTWVNWCSWT